MGLTQLTAILFKSAAILFGSSAWRLSSILATKKKEPRRIPFITASTLIVN